MEEKIFEENNSEYDESMHIELAKVSSRPEKVAVQKEVQEVPSDEVNGEEEGQLAIDVYQTPDEIVVESTIAGAKKEDLDIYVTNDSVTIKGKRERIHRVEEADYFYQECYWGRFSRSVILPQEVDPDKAASSLKNGVLTIRMPKLNQRQGKKLRVGLD